MARILHPVQTPGTPKLARSSSCALKRNEASTRSSDDLREQGEGRGKRGVVRERAKGAVRERSWYGMEEECACCAKKRINRRLVEG